MHELSIAIDLIDAASGRAREEGAQRIRAMYLRIGPLSGVVIRALESAFRVASQGTLADGALLDVEQVPLTLYCASCDATKAAADVYSFCCPDCGTPTSDVRSGRELEVKALEIEYD